jgi:hypothetical protein
MYGIQVPRNHAEAVRDLTGSQWGIGSGKFRRRFAQLCEYDAYKDLGKAHSYLMDKIIRMHFVYAAKHDGVASPDLLPEDT